MIINVIRDKKISEEADVNFYLESAIQSKIDLKDYGINAITPLYEKDGYLCMSAITEKGIITQKALTLNADYKYFRGDKIEIFSIGDNLCAMLVDCDVYRPEIFRYLAFKGVKVVFSTAIIKEEDYLEDFVLMGPWSNAQANGAFLVAANNLETNVICPCDLTNDQSGFINRKEKSSFTARLDLNRYYEGLRSFPIFQSINYDLYGKYFGGKK